METDVLRGKKVAVFIDKLYDEKEFIFPYYRLCEADADVSIVASEAGKYYKSKVGLKTRSEKAYSDVQASELDGIVIPGGFAPDYMRKDEACIKLVKEVNDLGKMVAFICHAGWVPASAGILKGKRCTSVASIKDDLVNAGGIWEDNCLVYDGNLVSSRTPEDLPEFAKGILHCMAEKMKDEPAMAL